MLEAKRARDRLIMISLLTNKKTVVVVSTYTPQQGLTNDKKRPFL